MSTLLAFYLGGYVGFMIKSWMFHPEKRESIIFIIIAVVCSIFWPLCLLLDYINREKQNG